MCFDIRRGIYFSSCENFAPSCSAALTSLPIPIHYCHNLKMGLLKEGILVPVKHKVMTSSVALFHRESVELTVQFRCTVLQPAEATLLLTPGFPFGLCGAALAFTLKTHVGHIATPVSVMDSRAASTFKPHRLASTLRRTRITLMIHGVTEGFYWVDERLLLDVSSQNVVKCKSPCYQPKVIQVPISNPLNTEATFR